MTRTSARLDIARLPPTTASGVGDIAVFGKYHFWHRDGGGLAAELQVTLPTGKLQRPSWHRSHAHAGFGDLVAGRKTSPHANVGYELWSKAVPFNDTVDASLETKSNTDSEWNSRLIGKATILLDVIGRRLRHGGTTGYEAVTVFGGTAQSQTSSEGPRCRFVRARCQMECWCRVLVTANTLLSLANLGLRANVIPVIGAEWAF